MTRRRLRCGILMNPVEHGNSQMHQVMRIIWWVKARRGPASRSQLKHTKNLQRYGDDLRNEICKKVIAMGV